MSKSASCCLFMWLQATCHGKHVQLVSSYADLTSVCTVENLVSAAY